MAKERRKTDDLTMWDDAKQMIRKARKLGGQWKPSGTAWTSSRRTAPSANRA